MFYVKIKQNGPFPPPKQEREREMAETVGYDKLAVMEKVAASLSEYISEESQKQKQRAKGHKLKRVEYIHFTMIHKYT